MTKLPDNRYSADREFCGHDTPRFIARFCGERLADSVLWPGRAGSQAPAFETRMEAAQACCDYEEHREASLREGLKQNARISFLED